MLRLSTNARTAWVGDLKVENKVGTDGQPYISKSITFKIASNRDYSINKVINGVTTKERPADFIFCKATGSTAQLIKDFASAKDANGKLISRHVALHGALETYTTKKPMQVSALINGVTQTIPFEIEVENTIFMVRDLEFLDNANKATTVTTIQAGIIQPTQSVSTVQPTSQSTQSVSTVQPTSQSTQSSVEPTTSQPTVTQSVTEQPPQVVESTVTTSQSVQQATVPESSNSSCPW